MVCRLLTDPVRIKRSRPIVVDVVAARTMVASECPEKLDRVEHVADVGAFGDAVNVGHGFTKE
jgi:hypothetical protein